MLGRAGFLRDATVAQHSELHDPGGAGEGDEQDPGNRCQQQCHSHRQGAVRAEERHLSALPVLQYEDEQQQEYDREHHGSDPQTSDPRALHRRPRGHRTRSIGATVIVVREDSNMTVPGCGHHEPPPSEEHLAGLSAMVRRRVRLIADP
jgi:hypothetical protein